MDIHKSLVGGVGIAERFFGSGSCAASLSTSLFSAAVLLSSSSEARNCALSLFCPLVASGASATRTEAALSTVALPTPPEAAGCWSGEPISLNNITPKTIRASDNSRQNAAHLRRLLNLRRSDLLPMCPLRPSHLCKSCTRSASLPLRRTKHARDFSSTYRKAIEYLMNIS